MTPPEPPRLSEAASECVYGHEWDAGTWGVILGVSRCRRCGVTATARHFEVEPHDG